jgi:hypothetical protein
VTDTRSLTLVDTFCYAISPLGHRVRVTSGASKRHDTAWMRWMVETAKRLGEAQPPKLETTTSHPRYKWVSPPYPRLVTERTINGYGDKLAEFAELYLPPTGRRSRWRFNDETVRRVLANMSAIVAWATRASPVGIGGRVTLSLGKGRDGRPSLMIGYDDALVVLLAFAALASRFCGRVRCCEGCGSAFVASDARTRFCSKRCGSRIRGRRKRRRYR